MSTPFKWISESTFPPLVEYGARSHASATPDIDHDKVKYARGKCSISGKFQAVTFTPVGGLGGFFFFMKEWCQSSCCVRALLID